MTLYDCRDAFTQTLEALAAENPDIVAVVNDSVGSSKLTGFRDKWPGRLINVGIAEQNMIGVAAGLANGGKMPFVAGASCFLTGRALEQIKADIAYSNANVKLCGISSGMAYGELGPTHHSIEDFAWIRALPNLPIIAPADRHETAAAVRWAAGYAGPVYLRLSRVGVPDLFAADHVFTLGRANLLRAQGNLQEAMADLDQAIRLNPDEAQAFHARGLIYQRNGDHVRAITDFDNAIDRNPFAAAPYQARAQSLTATGKYDLAIEDFNAALNVDNRNGDAWAGLGLAYEKQGDKTKASESYGRALVVDPGNKIAREGQSRTGRA